MVEDTLDTIDTHCVGLQAQLEAGSRVARRIGRDAARGRELQQCIREQLAALADLRAELATLRQELRVRRSAIEGAGAGAREL